MDNREGVMRVAWMNREEQIEYVANRIALILTRGLDPKTYAEALINELDDDDYSAHIEVRALHTRNNKPFTFWL